MFAYLFGIKPWEIRRLTFRQYEIFTAAIDDYLREAKRNNGTR